MTREEFDRLVHEVEEGIGRNPIALRRRTLWLALVGYAGLLAWLICIVLFAAAFFSALSWADLPGKVVCCIMGLSVLIGGGGLALHALLVRTEPPEGRIVTRAEAPTLFATLDELQRQIRSEPFHTVMLTADCNAGVMQVPRLGVFGWSRNYLLLGLPLLEGLSRDEMRAVLAHEFTHLSRQHGRFSHWLYRLRRSWAQIFPQLSRAHRGPLSLRPLVIKYVNWFWPRFNAHAFVLSRANEYEADAQAARSCGQENMVAALVRLRLLARLLDKKFWPETWRLANEQPEPPPDIMERLHRALHEGGSAEERSLWLDEAFRVTTTNEDTHPCLSERLRALPGTVLPSRSSLLVAATPSAAETLLGAALESLRRDVQERWRRDVASDWRQHHQRASLLGSRLVSINQVATAAAAKDAEALWDKAVVLFDLRAHETLEPLLREILAARADHTLANFHLGRILLEKGQAEGESYVERAMMSDDTWVSASCGLLRDHYRRIGATEKLRALSIREDRHEKELAASQEERRSVDVRDQLIPHGLSLPDLELLWHVLATEPELQHADLAQKQLRYFPEKKLFVLCVRRAGAWHRLPNRERDRALVRRLSQAVRLPGRVLVFPPSDSFRALARKLQRVPGAEIWSNGSPAG
jgi:Zn-dependent protease with chaperone function